MCKQIKDILHPLNISGRKILHLTYDTTDTPITDDEQIFTIEWEGKQLQVAYTEHQFSRVIPHRYDRYIAVKNTFTTGGTYIVRARAYHPKPGRYDEIDGNILYLKCTNVSKLIINGEQLI